MRPGRAIDRTGLRGWVHRTAHRTLWQSLPRRWRRGGLLAASALLAPRPTAGAPARAPVVVVGFLTAATGLGASVRLCHDALASEGREVLGIDLTERFRQGRDRVAFAFRDGAAHRGPGTLILHVNAPWVPLALLTIGRGVVAGKHVVGYWAWELPTAPPEWAIGVPFVHRILVPSRFTQQAVRAVAGATPVDVLAHPVALGGMCRPPPRDAPTPFTALVVFNMASGFTRKNPLAAIETFRLAFPNRTDVRLIVKLQNADSYPDGARLLREAAAATPNVHLDDRTLSSEAVRDLIADSDVVISLHRAEGFGLVVAEAMLAGRPVIATDWSGNADFLDHTTGLPVSARLIPARDPQGEYDHPGQLWAEPDVAAAAGALRRLHGAPALRDRLGRAAAAAAADRFGAGTYVARLSALLAVTGHAQDAVDNGHRSPP